MRIIITGASGALGSLVLSGLRAVAGQAEVVPASSRHSEGLLVDFDRPESLTEAFRGADAVLLVSAGMAEDDVVLRRHEAAVRAAEEAGVRHVVYTSLIGSAELTSIALAHRFTERLLAQASLDATILRNGLYAELVGFFAASTGSPGVVGLPWGAGALAPIARRDLADAAATVLRDIADGSGGKHAGAVYELDGVERIDGTAVAQVLGATYAPTPVSAVHSAALAAGVPAFQVSHSLSIHANIQADMLEPGRSDSVRLLGRDLRPVRPIIAATARHA